VRAVGLRCVTCRAEYPIGLMLSGCPACAATPLRAALEVVYDWSGLDPVELSAGWRSSQDRSLWRFRELLPLPGGARPLSLGEGGTPLVHLAASGPNPLERLYVKNETVNPTWSFKDRFHAVSVSVGRELGATRLIASTTGNHGNSLAAYGAAAGMPTRILVDPRTPAVQQDLIALHGASLDRVMERQAALREYVLEDAWYPSTYMTPIPVGTPYGVEGYKTIAYELALELAQPPGHVLFPVAAGDGLYGPWKGFRDLHELGLLDAPPRMHAVQATGVKPIVDAFEQGLDEPLFEADPQTIALSIADRTGGSVALMALTESKGGAVDVSEREIVDALRFLASHGIAVEPASAATVAGAWKQARRGEIDTGDVIVCILTGGAVKWPETLARLIAGYPE
jgi:threonine synthase